LDSFLTKLLLVIIVSIAAGRCRKPRSKTGMLGKSSGAILVKGLRLAIDILVLWTVVVLAGRLIACLS